MVTKSIGELTQDEFLRILGPDQGSSRNGSRVAVSRSTRDSCVNVVDGKLQVNGNDSEDGQQGSSHGDIRGQCCNEDSER